VGALTGVVVLDLGTFIAGPFCATTLGEFGATVIKVERPGGGDSLRKFGTETECGDSLIWLSESRNKKCISLNLDDPRGLSLLKDLISKSDVIVENFRPGVMEKWGVGFDQIRALNPGAILVRISAYGQNGPYRERPGFARVAHAFSGLAYLAGEPDRVPVVPGSTSLADYLAGLYGAIGALLALRARESTGEGQCVDLALYEPIFRILDELAPAFQKFGVVRERMGADTIHACPHGHYPTRDGEWVAIACSSDLMFERLCKAMSQPELASVERFGRKQNRLDQREEVNQIVSDWTSSQTATDIVSVCDEAGVPAGQINNIADIFSDPQYQARENIKIAESRAGMVAVPNVVPKLSKDPGAIAWLGQSVGSHNDEVYSEFLGLNPTEIQALQRAGVI